MTRSFSPEEDFRWDDLSRLPKVGKLFFKMAEMLSDEPVSHELDAVVTTSKDEFGGIVEMPVPEEYSVDPVGLLRRLAEIPHYRGNFIPVSKKNLVTVTRLGASSIESILKRLPPEGVGPEDSEKMRWILAIIHYKMAEGYMSVAHMSFLGNTVKLFRTFDEAGQNITGHESPEFEERPHRTV